MALARTTRVGAASTINFGTGAYTPTGATFTPANNSILVACVEVGFSSGNGVWGPTISDTASGVWTQRASATSTAGSWASGIRLWTCPVVTGTSRTISFDQGAVSVDGGYAVSILEFTGQDGTTPQAGGTAKIAAGTDGADSVTLGATPATGDYELGFCGREMNAGTATSTQGATFTELQDFTTSAGVGMESEERTASTSTTVDWADLNTAAGNVFRIALAGIIIKVAAGTDATATPAAITATVAMDAATTSAGSTPTPTEIVASVAMDGPTESAGSTPTPAAIVGPVAMDAVTTSAGSTPTPAAIVAPAVMDAVTLAAGATTAPPEIVASVTMDAVVASGGTATSPAEIVAAVTMDAAMATAGATPTPVTIVSAVTMDAATTTAGATATPAEIVVLVAMDAVAASGSGSATATPAAITGIVTIDTPTLSAGAAVAVAEIVAQAVIDAVAASASSTTAPAAIVAPVSMDTVVLSAGGDTTPVAIVAFATLNAVTLAAGATAAPATIIALVVIDPVTATGNVIIPISLDRIYRIRPDDHTYVIVAEGHTFRIPPAPVLTIPVEDRTFIVRADRHTHTVEVP